MSFVNFLASAWAACWAPVVACVKLCIDVCTYVVEAIGTAVHSVIDAVTGCTDNNDKCTADPQPDCGSTDPCNDNDCTPTCTQTDAGMWW